MTSRLTVASLHRAGAMVDKPTLLNIRTVFVLKPTIYITIPFSWR